MAVRGQKFNLNLDADNYQFDIQDEDLTPPLETFNVVREVREREPTETPPPPPKLKSKLGFPEHRPRVATSRFKQRQEQKNPAGTPDKTAALNQVEPSDRAIAHHIGQKYGFDTEAKEKAKISEENKKKLANMSVDEIEEARAELMSGLNPSLIQRLLARANIEEDQPIQKWEQEDTTLDKKESKRNSLHLGHLDEVDGEAKKVKFAESSTTVQEGGNAEHKFGPSEPEKVMPDHPEQRGYPESTAELAPEATLGASSRQDTDLVKLNPSKGQNSMSDEPEEESILDQNKSLAVLNSEAGTHFPVPPRDAAAFPDLDPNSASFLEDLRSHYFPDTPHDPNSLTWLQDPTEEENKGSAYAPTQHAYAPSDIRFDFAGRLIPPSESETIPSSRGLHHHGDAPSSAGYTIPELAMLCRSSLPNQRCIAYQTLGRILYRLGRGDFGPKGTELNEGLWSCVEQERPLDVIMAEANKKGGHMSAKTYATEALWLWRKGGGGDRGVLKEGQRVVR